MSIETVKDLALKAINLPYYDISEAIERVAGKFSEETKDLHSAIYDEIENILYPHGTGEDQVYCEY